jgi:hypothetical protein
MSPLSRASFLGLRENADEPKTLKQFHVEADSPALPGLSRTGVGDCRRRWAMDDHPGP